MAARVATETETETSGPEQEEAAWAEARETREKVSHLMGQYLLKGFRMLSTNCTDCGVSPRAWSRLCTHTYVHMCFLGHLMIETRYVPLLGNRGIVCVSAHAQMI